MFWGQDQPVNLETGEIIITTKKNDESGSTESKRLVQ
jgi:hypothetical protein